MNGARASRREGRAGGRAGSHTRPSRAATASAGGGGARRGLTPRPRAWRVCHKTASTTCSFVPRHCLSPGLFPGHPNHPTGSLLLPDTFRKPGSNCICTCSSSPAAPHGSLAQTQARGSGALEGLASTSPPPSTPVSSTPGQTGPPPFPQLHGFTPKILSSLFTRGAQSPEGLLFNRC